VTKLSDIQTKPKRSSNRKIQIRDVARNMFKEKGYAATSMRGLASEVGIEAASLYNHIKSKHDILQEVCFEIAGHFLMNLEEPYDQNLSATERLKIAIENHLHVIIDNIDAAAVFFNEWRHLENEQLQIFKKMRGDYENHFLEILKAGQKSGEFRKVNEKLIALTLFNSMNWIYQRYQPKGKWDSKKIANELAELFITGIKNKN